MTATWTGVLPGGLETPCLLLDVDVLRTNVAGMATTMAQAGVALRPHVKTHKSVSVARMQVAAGARGLTVATLGEAEVFADAGFDDLFVAYPVVAAGAKATRLRALHERIRLRVGIENADGAASLARAVAGAGRPLDVVVEVDCTYHRTGVMPEEVPRLVEQAVDLGLRVVGVFTHGGHGYDPARRLQAARDEDIALQEALASLGHAGDGLVASAGSTPTASLVASGAVNEERPGTYVFNDRQQLAAGSCAADQLAVAVAATVVAVHGDRIVLDAGGKSLAADRPPWLEGHGFLPRVPGAHVRKLSDHHAQVDLPADAPRLDVGEVVAVVPNHVCPVVNLFDRYIVVSDGEVVDEWPVDARGRNT